MSTQSISTKELRDHLPRVRAGLARGDKYILIYRSKIIGRLEPVQKIVPKNIKLQAGGLRLQSKTKQKLTPEFLNKIATQRYE